MKEVREGRGIFKWISGGEYEGEFQRNLRHGRGVYKYPNNGGVFGTSSGTLNIRCAEL